MAHASTLRFVPGLRVLSVGALCAVLAGCGVNTIPTYEQSAKAAWSEVLNQYKRRADLILAQHFPPGALPRNELPNTLAEI